MTKKQKKEVALMVQNALYGWQVSIMKLSEISRLAEGAYELKLNVKETVEAYLSQPSSGAKKS